MSLSFAIRSSGYQAVFGVKWKCLSIWWHFSRSRTVKCWAKMATYRDHAKKKTKKNNTLGDHIDIGMAGWGFYTYDTLPRNQMDKSCVLIEKTADSVQPTLIMREDIGAGKSFRELVRPRFLRVNHFWTSTNRRECCSGVFEMKNDLTETHSHALPLPTTLLGNFIAFRLNVS